MGTCGCSALDVLRSLTLHTVPWRGLLAMPKHIGPARRAGYLIRLGGVQMLVCRFVAVLCRFGQQQIMEDGS